MFTVSVQELLIWLKKQVDFGCDEESLFLLLDILGGLSKRDLIALKINPHQEVKLKVSFNNITNSWIEHITTSRPIQQICESTYWRELKIKVNSDVLIPRVETEIIVDIVNNLFPFPQESIYFADLGTGSGAIAIALALSNPSWVGFATDCDNKALAIARHNFLNLSDCSNLSFYLGDWWGAFNGFSGKFDFIVSNPPYIPKEVYENLSIEVKNYEPKLALYGGSDGLKHIRNIIKGAPNFIKENGWVIIENHFDQGEKVKSLFNNYGFNSVKVINDLSGIGRFTIGRYN